MAWLAEKKSAIIFSLVNALGMICLVGFVWSARSLALIEERDFYDFGDSAGFLVTVAPVLLVCLVIDIIWACMALLAIWGRRSYQSAVVCVIVLAVWVVVYLASKELANIPSKLALQWMALPLSELLQLWS